jgi:hypothetical protein
MDDAMTTIMDDMISIKNIYIDKINEEPVLCVKINEIDGIFIAKFKKYFIGVTDKVCYLILGEHENHIKNKSFSEYEISQLFSSAKASYSVSLRCGCSNNRLTLVLSDQYDDYTNKYQISMYKN